MKRYALFLMLFVIFCVHYSPMTTAQTDKPLADYPVITAENVAQLQQVRVLGEGYINDVIFSPDEQFVAMATTIGIWLYSIDDLENPIHLFGDYAINVTYAMFSPDGSRLFGCVEGGAVYVWNVTSGELLFELHPPHYSYKIWEIRLSNDEQKLYIISSDLNIWNLNTYQLEQTITLNVAFDTIFDAKPVLSPNEKYILIHRNGGEGYDGQEFYFFSSRTVVLSIETGVPLYEIRDENLYIYNPQFDETSSKIVGILDYANWAIGIWDVESGDLLHIVGDNMMGYRENLTYAKPSEQSFSGLAKAVLSHDQSKVIFFLHSGEISVWDIATNIQLREYSFSIDNTADGNSPFKPYETIHFYDSTNEQLILEFIKEEQLLPKIPLYSVGSGILDNKILIRVQNNFFVFNDYIWSIETGEILSSLNIDDRCVGTGRHGFSQLSLQNSRVVHYTDNNVCIWDVEIEQLVNKIPTSRQYLTMNPYTLDTQHFVTISTSQIENRYSNEIWIWDLETNTKIQAESNPSGYLDIATFSHDGNYLAAIIGGYVYVWNTQNGEEINQVDVREIGFPESLVFSPDNRHLVIEGYPDIVASYVIMILWDYKNGAKRNINTTHIENLKFPLNGNYLLTNGYEKTILWDLVTGEQIYELYRKSNFPQTTFSPDGSYFAISHKNGFDIIETETGEMMYSFGIGGVSWVDFSPSGDMLMVVQGKTIQFWDIFALENLYTLQTPSIIDSAKFNEEGNLIITEMRDGTIRLFGVPEA